MTKVTVNGQGQTDHIEVAGDCYSEGSSRPAHWPRAPTVAGSVSKSPYMEDKSSGECCRKAPNGGTIGRSSGDRVGEARLDVDVPPSGTSLTVLRAPACGGCRTNSRRYGRTAVCRKPAVATSGPGSPPPVQLACQSRSSIRAIPATSPVPTASWPRPIGWTPACWPASWLGSRLPCAPTQRRHPGTPAPQSPPPLVADRAAEQQRQRQRQDHTDLDVDFVALAVALTVARAPVAAQVGVTPFARDSCARPGCRNSFPDAPRSAPHSRWPPDGHPHQSHAARPLPAPHRGRQAAKRGVVACMR